MGRALRCYAEGDNNRWEAICLDLDIAVQGRSFEEVYRSLNDAIGLYLESLADLPEAERCRLLHRSVPLGVRLRFLCRVLRDAFRKRSRDNRFQHQFTIPASA